MIKNYSLIDYIELNYLYPAGKISLILDFWASVSRRPALAALYTTA